MALNPAHFFTIDDLETLKSYEGKVLKSIKYINWVNKIVEGDTQIFTFWIEMEFENGILYLSKEDDHKHILLEPYDYQAEVENIKALAGKVFLHKMDMSSISLWKEVIGATLGAIELEFEVGNFYHRDVLLFNFGIGKQIIIEADVEEGLNSELYEEPKEDETTST